MQDPQEKIRRWLLWQIPFLLWLGLRGMALPAHAVEVRLADIARIQGMRENVLIGYGLVVGLQGTGDGRASALTARSMANLMEKFGLSLTDRDFSARNTASVMVTARLSAIVREGDAVDVHVSSVGDAKSLQGGTLLMTPLVAGNQKVYATAQGPISVGGYYAAQANQSIVKNVTTVGVIPSGAIVEKNVDAEFLKNNQLTLKLETTDFAVANRVVEGLNARFGVGTAKTANGTDIEILLPPRYEQQPAAFIAEALALRVEPSESAKVVIDERTGTVVVGGEVKISKVAISHGSLHIAIAGDILVSQPLPLTRGQTVVAEQLSLRADEGKSELVTLPAGTTIEELVRALNAIGTLPRDVVVILENLKAAGALFAQVVTR